MAAAIAFVESWMTYVNMLIKDKETATQELARVKQELAEIKAHYAKKTNAYLTDYKHLMTYITEHCECNDLPVNLLKEMESMSKCDDPAIVKRLAYLRHEADRCHESSVLSACESKVIDEFKSFMGNRQCIDYQVLRECYFSE